MIRIIEENYDSLYHEMIYWSKRRGRTVIITDFRDLMEHKVAFDMAIEYVKKHGLFRERWNSMEGRKKLTYKTVVAMKMYLNGEKE